MDQTIISILGGADNLGVIALILMQTYQMFLDNQKAINHEQVKDYQAQINILTAEITTLKDNMRLLEQEMFALKQENGELRGLLQAQENKEGLIRKYVQRKTK